MEFIVQFSKPNGIVGPERDYLNSLNNCPHTRLLYHLLFVFMKESLSLLASLPLPVAAHLFCELVPATAAAKNSLQLLLLLLLPRASESPPLPSLLHLLIPSRNAAHARAHTERRGQARECAFLSRQLVRNLVRANTHDYEHVEEAAGLAPSLDRSRSVASPGLAAAAAGGQISNFNGPIIIAAVVLTRAITAALTTKTKTSTRRTGGRETPENQSQPRRIGRTRASDQSIDRWMDEAPRILSNSSVLAE